MNFQSRKIKLNKSQQLTFEHLKEMSNYESLMPENSTFEVHESGQGFAVQLKGLPKVGLRLKEVQEPKSITFNSPSENFNYEMQVNINETGENHSEVFIDFNGKFNPMIEMMAKKPLTKLIETIADNLEKTDLG